jgi:Fic family protein
LIVSYDTIKMKYNKPPYQLTSEILDLLTQVSEKIGEVNAIQLNRPPAELRKSNRIKTIQSSLAIEGNTITEEQITALLNNKRILAPQKDIQEVQNAIEVYDKLHDYRAYQVKSLLSAHKMLMKGLISEAGKLRSGNVGIVKGSKITHVAPPGNIVNGLLNELLAYVKSDPDPILLKSCVFHYEFEFIHPFADGNGRMGRLWQTVILMNKYPLFEYLPIESVIKANQEKYYEALNKSDSYGHCTPFLVFILQSMLKALNSLLDTSNSFPDQKRRLFVFKEAIGNHTFNRKTYLEFFKIISSATASRDLKFATDTGLLHKTGDKRFTVYYFKNTGIA